MKTYFFKKAACLFAAVCCGISTLQAEMPEMPKPVKEHAWLEKLVGEWTSESKCFMPGQESMTSSGTEKARMMGGFWLISEGSGEAMGMKFSSQLTLGYDPEKGKYIGSWIDSMTGRMWNYVGTLNEAGTMLTLETEGPCPMQGGKITNIKEVIEFQDADHRTFTSSMLDENGKWVKVMEMKSVRKN